MLRFNVRNQYLSRLDSLQPVEKSVNYLTARFSFLTNEWNGLEKKVICRNIKTKKAYESKIENNIALIPWEALDESGAFEICVRGTGSDRVVPTSFVIVRIGATLETGAETQPPTPTELDLLRQEVEALEKKIDNDIPGIVDEYLKENPPNGGGLPPVTEEDNGKVMQVVDGEWAAAELPVYDGEFEVTPSATDDQTLLTAQKYMNANIIVNKIPYSEVSNNSGGTTAYIGG